MPLLWWECEDPSLLLKSLHTSFICYVVFSTGPANPTLPLEAAIADVLGNEREKVVETSLQFSMPWWLFYA